MICYIYFLEHYEKYQLSFEKAGAIALTVFGKMWEKGTCGTNLVFWWPSSRSSSSVAFKSHLMFFREYYNYNYLDVFINV